MKSPVTLSLALFSVLASLAAAPAGKAEATAAPAAPAAPAAKAAPTAPAAPAAKTAPAAAASQPAAEAYEKFKALVGDWIDMDGDFGVKDKVAASYRLTGAGTTVVETVFTGQPHEMMTMYSKDGSDLVLTHYCAGGNQPRMRARTLEGNIVRFTFDGGTNLDAATDAHMHSAWFEFVSADEIRGGWEGWDDGKPSEHKVKFHLKRKTS